MQARRGRLDILINNAAINYDRHQSVLDADLDEVSTTLDVNILGHWRVTQALLPLLCASGRGRVVNVSSGVGAWRALSGGTPVYSLSKLALNGLTRMLATGDRSRRSLTAGQGGTKMGLSHPQGGRGSR